MRSRRVQRDENTSKDKSIFLVLAVISLIITAGVIAYNADNLVSYNNSQLSAILPSDYSGGERIVFPAVVNDVNGNPRSDKEIEVYLEREDSKKELLYEGKTSDEGFSNVEFDLPRGEYEANLTVESDGEKLTKQIEVRGKTRLFVSMDKPIYQPGQTVHIRSLAFLGEDPYNDEVTYTIKTPQGDKIFRKTLSTNEFGISYYNYSLSDLLPLGTYELEVKTDEKTVKEVFLVDRYVLPRFNVNYRGLEDWYITGNSISGTLDIQYFFGKNVEGNAKVSLVYNGNKIDQHNMYIEDGQAPFILDLPDKIIDGQKYITLNTTVTDTSGHSEWDTKDIPLDDKQINIQMIPTKYVEGTRSIFKFKVSHPGGFSAGSLNLTAELGGIELSTKTTNTAGMVSWERMYDGEEEITISCVYEGNTYTETFEIEKSDGLKIVPMEGGNKVGDEKSFQIYYKGTSLTNRIYYSVQTQTSILYSGYFTLDDQPYNLSVPITYELSPEFKLTAHSVEKDLSFNSDSVSVSVSQDEYLELQILKDKEVYEPGDEARLGFKVTKEGKAIRAALGVKITDEAIYELNQLSGLDKILLKNKTEEPEERGFEVKTVGMTQQKASDLKKEWVSTYWSLLTITGMISLLVLFVFAMKKNPIAVSLIGIFLIVGSATSFYVMENINKQGTSIDEGDMAPGGGIQPGRPEGNLQEEEREKDYADSETEEQEESEQRVNFPETWYWNPTLITNGNGEANIELITPDSITSWIVDGEASTKQGELFGNSTRLTVSKDFFIEPDIPVSVVRGDRFELRVIIYNYLNESISANITLQDSEWFELHDDSTKMIDLEKDSVGSVYYNITALEVGENTISFEAEGEEEQDSIMKIMRVTPDGKKYVDVFNGQLTNNDNATHSFIQDENVIPNSQLAYLKLYGGMDSVTLDSAEGFIHQVMGCGEQSMSTLSIDILAYDIVKGSENPPDDLENYEKIVTQGIQHELGFLKEAENGEGRGIVWFPEDQDVHPWLTSWGLITFQDAIDAGLTVDESIIEDMQSWLISQQNSDGSWEFPEWGLYETTNEILRAKKVATTAYIARSLIYSGYDKSSSDIERAVGYIKDNIDGHMEDPYTLSISALSLKMAGEEEGVYNDIIDKIYSLRVEENGTCHWETETSLIQGGEGYGFRGSKIIETTGYAVMALHGSQYYDTVDKAVQYLLNNRNQFGSFFSTQDTVVALQALQRSGDVDIENMEISVFMNGNEVDTITFTEDNKDMTYLIDLRDYLNISNEVKLSSDGRGKIAYQLVYEEYVGWEILDNKDIFMNLEIPNNADVDEEYVITLELTYGEKAPYSKMGLIEIPLPTGFQEINYDYLLKNEYVSNWEVKDGVVRFYLTDLSQGESLSLDIKFIPSREGEIQIQGINYHDMYSPSIRVEVDPEIITID